MNRKSSVYISACMGGLLALSLFWSVIFTQANEVDPFAQIPTPYIPKPGEYIINGNLTKAAVIPEFLWGVAALSDWYHLAVINDTGTTVIDRWFAAGEICEANVCSFKPDASLLPVGLLNSTYSWWVQSWDDDGTPAGLLSNWMSGTPFTVAVPLPASLSVDNDAIDAATGRAVLHLPNDPGTTWYHIWIGKTDFTETVFQGWLSKPDFTCTLAECTLIPDAQPANGEYAIYMQTWGPAGFNNNDANFWTKVGEFTVELPAPGLVTSLTAIQNGDSVILTWDGQPNARAYNVWFGTSDFIQTLHSQWHSDATLNCTGGEICTLTLSDVHPQAGKTYLWYIQSWGPGGMSTGGDEGGWTKSAPFTPMG